MSDRVRPLINCGEKVEKPYRVPLLLLMSPTALTRENDTYYTYRMTVSLWPRLPSISGSRLLLLGKWIEAQSVVPWSPVSWLAKGLSIFHIG